MLNLFEVLHTHTYFVMQNVKNVAIFSIDCNICVIFCFSSLCYFLVFTFCKNRNMSNITEVRKGI